MSATSKNSSNGRPEANEMAAGYRLATSFRKFIDSRAGSTRAACKLDAVRSKGGPSATSGVVDGRSVVVIEAPLVQRAISHPVPILSGYGRFRYFIRNGRSAVPFTWRNGTAQRSRYLAKPPQTT